MSAVNSPTSTAGALELANVTVHLDGSPVVSEVSLAVEPGQWLSLIGPNGAGKSTLLRAVAGLVGHTGSVAANGKPRGKTSTGRHAAIAIDVAMVAQNPVLPVGMTVIEYVLLGRTAHGHTANGGRSRLGWLRGESSNDRYVAAQVLAQMDLGQFANRYITQLSGGEAQRVVLARALAQEPSILLLDEPTSALDVGHQFAVLELVDKLRFSLGLTVVAAMHDLTLAARFSDQIALLADGRIHSVGSPNDVLNAASLSEAYGAPLTVSKIEDDLVVLPASPAATSTSNFPFANPTTEDPT